jgi:tetratricopeptide (TPR) repeat protein
MPPAARLPALLAAVVTLAYLGSFAGSFQFDDFNVIVANPTVHSLGAWLADLGHGIRPALKLTYALNWTLGPSEAGFHAVNLAVHVTNTLLVFFLARLLARRSAPAAESGAAVVAALLFGLHPAQTEAVTYISGRSASLMAMFYLGGLCAYAAGTEARRPWLLYAVSPALFCLAVATKEVAVTFPLALLWWEWFRREGPVDWRELARRQAVHGFVFLALAIALLAHPVYGTRLVPALDPESLRQNALTQVGAVSYLVLRLFRPFSLDIDPDLRVASSWNLTLAVEAAFLAGVVAAALLCARRRPWWALGLAWFVVQLLPTNSLLPRADLANDRHLYLASFGIFVAAGIEIGRLAGPPSPGRRWPWSLAAAVAVLLAVSTALRNRDYASEIALWEQTARVSPGKPRVFNNLGHAYSQAGQPEAAERAYLEALRLHPGYQLARDNLEVLRRRNAERAPAAR